MQDLMKTMVEKKYELLSNIFREHNFKLTSIKDDLINKNIENIVTKLVDEKCTELKENHINGFNALEKKRTIQMSEIQQSIDSKFEALTQENTSKIA